MPVYGTKIIEDLCTSLSSLADKMFTKTTMVMKDEEMLAAYIIPDHLTMLKEVQAMCDPGTNTYVISHETCTNGAVMRLDYCFKGCSSVIMPKYVTKGLQPFCPEHLRTRVKDFVDQRHAFGTAFGDVRDALHYLNATCGDARAMAVMLPCLPTIMSNMSPDPDSPAVKRARKLKSSSGFGALPPLPREVKNRLMEVSAIVNSVTLLSDAHTPTVQKHDAYITAAYLAENAVRGNIFYPGGHNILTPLACFM